jgi:hypothetical protein
VVLEKLMDAYSQIADALPRFNRFQSAFHYDPNIKQALALVYEDILEFHRNTYVFLKRGGKSSILPKFGGKCLTKSSLASPV